MNQRADTAEEHLHLEHLVGYVRGTLDPAEHAGVQRHLSGCVRCTREVGDVVRLSRPASQRDRPRRFGPAAGIAAALLLGVWTTLRTGPDRALPTRDETLAEAAAPRPFAPTTSRAGEVTFHWSPVSKADHYRLVLFDSTGSAILERESADTALGLPDSVRLTSGALYLWKVEAQTSWDRWVSSALVHFRPAGPTPP